MDSTGKSSSRLEPAIVAVDGANTPNNTGSTRSIAPWDMNLQPADDGDEDGMHVDLMEAEGGGGASSSQLRNYARLSYEQSDQLETVFQQNHFPDTKTKEELAARTGMTLGKVHIWFRSRRTRFNQIKRDEDQKQQVSTLVEKIKSLAEKNILLTEKIIPLTDRVSSLAEKIISLFDKNSSLTDEKRRLESELEEIKAAPMPPVMLPVHGLPQVFVALCRVCSLIFRDAKTAAGALPGSQKGCASASTSASTSTATPTPCPDCLKTLENMEAMVASFAQQQQGSA